MEEEVVTFKSGWLQKRSKHIGIWRKRWTVLTSQCLCTYKTNQMIYNYEATEIIQLSTMNVINIAVSCKQMFFIKSNDIDIYQFKADTECEKDKWIHKINYAKKCIKIPVHIECPSHRKYNYNFKLVKPYNRNYLYSINALIADIIDYIEKHYHQKYDQKLNFVPMKIKADSFIGYELNYNDYDWSEPTNYITDYTERMVIIKGIYMEIDFDIYRHDISSFFVSCDDVKNEESTEVDDNTEVDNNTNTELDRRRYALFRQGISSFCLNTLWAENHPLYIATEKEKEIGILNLLILEVVSNGFESDLYFDEENDIETKTNLDVIIERVKNKQYKILYAVDEKLEDERHKQMRCPLNRSEMLSLLLYTGGKSYEELGRSQRAGDYAKWKWFDYCLYNAISKLSYREYGSYKIYTGLKSTKLDDNFISCGYFKTYVSTSWRREIAERFADDDGMIIEIDETFREKAICCDVSWISQYAESEILIARSIDAVLGNFQCKVLAERDENGRQIVSLCLYQEINVRKSESKSIKLIQSHNNSDKLLYSSYETESKSKDRKNKITKYQTEVVNLYIKSIERMLKPMLKRIMEKNICNLIVVYHGNGSNYISQQETFTVHYKGMQVINAVSLINRAGNASTAFGDVIVYGLFENRHSWEISIDKLSKNWGRWKQPIMIGIVENTKLDTFEMYGYDNFGTIYKKKICNEMIGNKAFKEGDIIVISYDGRTGILQGGKENKYTKKFQKWPMIDGIDTNCDYRLIITINGKYDQATIINHTCDST